MEIQKEDLTQQELDEISLAWQQIRRWLFALGLSVLLVLLGWFGYGNFFGEDRHTWFAKSGAFSTVMLIWASRYEQGILRKYYLGPASMPIRAAKTSLNEIVPKLESVTFAFAIISAFIWGYGDTFHKWVNS